MLLHRNCLRLHSVYERILSVSSKQLASEISALVRDPASGGDVVDALCTRGVALTDTEPWAAALRHFTGQGKGTVPALTKVARAAKRDKGGLPSALLPLWEDSVLSACGSVPGMSDGELVALVWCCTVAPTEVITKAKVSCLCRRSRCLLLAGGSPHPLSVAKHSQLLWAVSQCPSMYKHTLQGDTSAALAALCGRPIRSFTASNILALCQAYANFVKQGYPGCGSLAEFVLPNWRVVLTRSGRSECGDILASLLRSGAVSSALHPEVVPMAEGVLREGLVSDPMKATYTVLQILGECAFEVTTRANKEESALRARTRVAPVFGEASKAIISKGLLSHGMRGPSDVASLLWPYGAARVFDRTVVPAAVSKFLAYPGKRSENDSWRVIWAVGQLGPASVEGVDGAALASLCEAMLRREGGASARVSVLRVAVGVLGLKLPDALVHEVIDTAAAAPVGSTPSDLNAFATQAILTGLVHQGPPFLHSGAYSRLVAMLSPGHMTDAKVSILHEKVGALVKRALGGAVEFEFDVVKEVPNLLSVDLFHPPSGLCVEVDGPSHQLIFPGSSDDPISDGRTVMKRRVLEALGYKVTSVTQQDRQNLPEHTITQRLRQKAA